MATTEKNTGTNLQELVEKWRKKTHSWAMHIDSFATVDMAFEDMAKDTATSTKSPREFMATWKAKISEWTMDENTSFTMKRILESMEEDASDSTVNPALAEFVARRKDEVRGWTMHVDSLQTTDDVFAVLEVAAKHSSEPLAEFVTKWKNEIAGWVMNKESAYITARFLNFMEEDALELSSDERFARMGLK